MSNQKEHRQIEYLAADICEEWRKLEPDEQKSIGIIVPNIGGPTMYVTVGPLENHPLGANHG